MCIRDRYNLVDEIGTDFKLNDLGSFVVNSTLRFGYQTGKIKPQTPNKYVARAIFE